MICVNVAAGGLCHRAAMDEHAKSAPPCPRCGKPMSFVRSLPKLGALLELRTYQCKPCGETVTEADEPHAVNASFAGRPDAG